MADINLLPTEERTAERIDFARKKLLTVSIVILVITAISTLATLGFYTSLVSKRSQLVKDVQSSSVAISDLQATEELITVVKAKASIADKILSIRSNLPSIFSQLEELVPQGLYFSDLRLSADKLVISGKARSSADMAGFVTALSSQKGAQIVSNVTIDSLSSDESGAYTFVVSAQLAGK